MSALLQTMEEKVTFADWLLHERRLTETQHTVYVYSLFGKTAPEIAEYLGIEPDTVYYHRAKAHFKVRIHSQEGSTGHRAFKQAKDRYEPNNPDYVDITMRDAHRRVGLMRVVSHDLGVED